MGDPITLIAIAILLPVLAGALVYLIPNPSLRRALVLVNAVALSAVAILLAANERLEVALPEGFAWPQLLLVLDSLLVVVMLGLAFWTKRIQAIVLAAAQLALVFYISFGVGHHESHAPTFVLDRLGTTLGLIVSIIGSLIVVFALRYMNEHEEHHRGHNGVARSAQPRFFFFLLLFLGAMNGLVFANDLGWVFFFWEITTLCSFMLIAHDRTPIAIANATRALWMNLIGGIAFGGAILVLALQGQEASLTSLLAEPVSGLPLIAVSLITFAGMTKSAQMPFQSWLLGAMVAPTPVSALLHSAAMVKAGVYIIVRLAPAYRGTLVSDAVAVVGGFTFLLTAILALLQTDGKRVLAYSTISNLGLIVACAGINTDLALAAAVMLILFHAVSKALLFLCVGTIEHKIGSRDIDAMDGLFARQPRLAILTAVGIITMALPPAGMLLAKWIAIGASAASGGLMPFITVLLAIGSATTLGFWARWLGKLFTSPPGVGRANVSLGGIYAATLGPLAGGALVSSLFAGSIFDGFLEPGMKAYYAATSLNSVGLETVAVQSGSFPIGAIYALAIVAFAVPALLVRVKPSQLRPVYMCGDNSGGVSADGFQTATDVRVQSSVASSLYGKFFVEPTLLRWGNPIAALLLVVLLATGVLMGVR